MRITGLIPIATIAALTGCATPTAQTIADAVPVNYEAQIRQAARDVYVDPGSIRDVEISEPFPVSAVFDGSTPFPHSGYAVCMVANARNRMGGYTGRQPQLFLFKQGRIALVIGGADFGPQVADHCARGRYRPIEVASVIQQ